jgi:hypothetical protein
VSSFRAEAGVYLDHVVALAIPGRRVRPHQVVPPEVAAVGTLDGWKDNDLDLLIEECRRSLDSQHTRFDRLRTTAQVVLPISVAVLVVLGSGLRRIVSEPSDTVRYAMYVVWAFGSGLVLLSALGAAATLSVRSDFGSVQPTLLSQLQPPLRKQLAKAYTEQIMVGETTVGTRITVIRDSITLLALGGVLQVGLWLINVL